MSPTRTMRTACVAFVLVVAGTPMSSSQLTLEARFDDAGRAALE